MQALAVGKGQQAVLTPRKAQRCSRNVLASAVEPPSSSSSMFGTLLHCQSRRLAHAAAVRHLPCSVHAWTSSQGGPSSWQLHGSLNTTSPSSRAKASSGSATPSAYASSTSVAATNQAAEPVNVPPAVDSLFSTKGGTWRVRPFNNADWQDVVNIQTSSFHETNPVAVLDKFMYKQFEAEVVDALRQKFKYSSPEFFQMLVAEEMGADGSAADADDLQDRSVLLPPSSSQSQPSHAASNGSAVSSSIGSSPASWGEDTQQQQQRRRVLGVVEVSLMDTPDVLRQMPPGSQQYCYVSSMAVHADMRRRGIAQALLQAAEMQSVMWRQPNLTLHVHKDNKAGVALYSACGFNVLSEDPSWKAVLGGRIRVLMHKDLGRLIAAEEEGEGAAPESQ